jgi:hypothetical protein
MGKQKLNPHPNWRCRREEYLRAAGRRDELISEGYEAAPPLPEWTVLPGGRCDTLGDLWATTRLCLVKGANS